MIMLEAYLPDGITVSDIEQLLAGLRTELKVEIGVRSITPVTF